MISDFVKFPSTPHLLWLSDESLRDDKLLTSAEVGVFLGDEVVIEEKVDGANLGISFDGTGEVQFQNRGSVVNARHGQFTKLGEWFAARSDRLLEALEDRFICFGEWCYARHSVAYTRLPDWFLCFDIWDRQRELFLACKHRNRIATAGGLAVVPFVARGHFTLQELPGLIGASALYDGPMEGLYLRREAGDRLIARAKLVRPQFVQSISEHWASRKLQRNEVVTAQVSAINL